MKIKTNICLFTIKYQLNTNLFILLFDKYAFLLSKYENMIYIQIYSIINTWLFYASLRSTVADAWANGNKVISAKTTWAGRVTTKAIVSATSWGVKGTKPL